MGGGGEGRANDGHGIWGMILLKMKEEEMTEFKERNAIDIKLVLLKECRLILALFTLDSMSHTTRAFFLSLLCTPYVQIQLNPPFSLPPYENKSFPINLI
jgi:hypothetical protein